MAFDGDRLRKVAEERARAATKKRKDDGVVRCRYQKRPRKDTCGVGESSRRGAEVPLQSSRETRRPPPRDHPGHVSPAPEVAPEGPTLADLRSKLEESLHPGLLEKYTEEMSIENGIDHFLNAAMKLASIG